MDFIGKRTVIRIISTIDNLCFVIVPILQKTFGAAVLSARIYLVFLAFGNTVYNVAVEYTIVFTQCNYVLVRVQDFVYLVTFRYYDFGNCVIFLFQFLSSY